MNQHYSEADLLETYYTQPGESLPVMLHLADCTACAARYERLETKIRGLAACDDEKPVAFWARQRGAIMRRVGRQRSTPAFARFAAAALLALLIGATVVWPIREQKTAQQPAVEAEAITLSEDPWESESLQEYQPLVEWESWVEDGGKS
jgi:predicted anti-sigma-YlaC factor YlaD